MDEGQPEGVRRDRNRTRQTVWTTGESDVTVYLVVEVKTPDESETIAVFADHDKATAFADRYKAISEEAGLTEDNSSYDVRVDDELCVVDEAVSEDLLRQHWRHHNRDRFNPEYYESTTAPGRVTDESGCG